MQINVAQQLKERVGSVRKYTLHEERFVLDSHDNALVNGELVLLRTDKGILVTGKLETFIRCTCSRCLADFEQSLKFHLEEEYFPAIDVLTGTPLSIPEEGAFVIDQNHVLNLDEAVRQYVILSIPLKPLCGEDCAGLCPICGANLNQEPCHCKAQTSGGRWIELRKLLSSVGERQEK